jgi:NAD(P)-dependent dehydrogenase (short-subunit alcohol dehydrogenase family)
MTITTQKNYLVTGATSGIGLAIIEILAAKGQRLIGVGRSLERCSEQQNRLRETYPQTQIVYLVADLSQQIQIRHLAKRVPEVLESWGQSSLDGLINNAGTFTFWQALTTEGFETQWAVNHLAPFLLTNLLLPVLDKAPSARILTVSSGSHYGARLNWSDIQGLGRYNPLKAYKVTKLANVLFSVELNRRLGPGSSVRALAVDPGLVNTGIGGKSRSRIAALVWKWRRNKGLSPAQSAAGIVETLEKDLNGSPGVYWKHGQSKKPDPYALEEDYGWRLWEISLQMTGLM